MTTRNCFLTLLCSLLTGIQTQAFERTLSARDGNNCQAIQAAIDTLPANRSHIASVTLKGEFQLKKSIRLPNFTRLDLRSAKLTLAAQSHTSMIVNADPEAGNHHLQIIGGLLDGRTADQSIGDYHGIEFTRVQEAHIIDMDIRNCSGDGIRLTEKAVILAICSFVGSAYMIIVAADSMSCGQSATFSSAMFLQRAMAKWASVLITPKVYIKTLQPIKIADMASSFAIFLGEPITI